MSYHYPAIARFMAAHWATEAVHIVPVFGERGALLEHWIFCLFYNWPLTVRRRMLSISESRRVVPVRIWHIIPATLFAAGLFAAAHYGYYVNTGNAPANENMWFIKPLLCLIVLVPAAVGYAVTRFAGGLLRLKRIGLAALGGLTVGILYSLAASVMEQGWNLEKGQLWVPLIWRSFAMSVFAAIGAIITEIRTAEPDDQN
jgi:hypothetical protein